MFSIHSSPTGDLGTKDTGGMSVYVRELVQELGSRGHHVDIYTRNCENSKHTIIKLHKNVRLIHLHAGSASSMPKNIARNGSPEPELRIAVEKRLAKTCSSIIVGAAREKENLVRYYTTPRDKISVVACGVGAGSRIHAFRHCCY